MFYGATNFTENSTLPQVLGALWNLSWVKVEHNNKTKRNELLKRLNEI